MRSSAACHSYVTAGLDRVDGPLTASVCQSWVVDNTNRREPSMKQVTTIGLIRPKQRFRCTGTGTTKGRGVEKGTTRFGLFDHLDDSGLPLTRHFEARSSVNRTPRHAEARVEGPASLHHPAKNSGDARGGSPARAPGGHSRDGLPLAVD